MKFYIQKLDCKDWPIQVSYVTEWLDAGSYWYRDKLVNWLNAQNIEFVQSQYFKIFTFKFRNEQDSSLFVLTWS